MWRCKTKVSVKAKLYLKYIEYRHFGKPLDITTNQLKNHTLCNNNAFDPTIRIANKLQRRLLASVEAYQKNKPNEP